jgi:hypothetical protein
MMRLTLVGLLFNHPTKECRAMTEDSKLLPAPEEQPSNDWLLPVLVFFGAFIVILLLVLGGGGPADSGLSVAEKPETAASTEATAVVNEITAPMPGIASNGKIEIVSPADGETVGTTFTVVLQATYVTVEPAGEIHNNAGHFHILVDEPFTEVGEVVPNDETHIHMGDGSRERELQLAPGEHTLRVQFADGAHRVYGGDGLRAEITITVAE